MSKDLEQLIQLLNNMNYEELLLFILKMNALNLERTGEGSGSCHPGNP